jgi:hypothetical protein
MVAEQVILNDDQQHDGGNIEGYDINANVHGSVGGKKRRGSRTRKGKKGKKGKKGRGSSSSSKKSKKVKRGKSGKKGKASGWINHVKQYAKKHGIKYPEALKDKNCGVEYRRNK